MRTIELNFLRSVSNTKQWLVPEKTNLATLQCSVARTNELRQKVEVCKKRMRYEGKTKTEKEAWQYGRPNIRSRQDIRGCLSSVTWHPFSPNHLPTCPLVFVLSLPGVLSVSFWNSGPFSIRHWLRDIRDKELNFSYIYLLFYSLTFVTSSLQFPAAGFPKWWDYFISNLYITDLLKKEHLLPRTKLFS